MNPLEGNIGSIGCIEICGPGEWARFNKAIKLLAGCKTEKEVSDNGYAKIVYQAAKKPYLKKA